MPQNFQVHGLSLAEYKDKSFACVQCKHLKLFSAFPRSQRSLIKKGHASNNITCSECMHPQCKQCGLPNPGNLYCSQCRNQEYEFQYVCSQCRKTGKLADFPETMHSDILCQRKKQREQDPARHIFEAPAKCSQCRQKTQQQNIIQCELCGLFNDLATMERMHARKICIACKHLSFAHCGVKYQEIESLVFRMNNSGVRGITIVVVEWVKTCGNEGEEMKY